ncbi:MAG: hypothetical protein AAFR16_04300 [Pseudomonadota bacterium]
MSYDTPRPDRPPAQAPATAAEALERFPQVHRLALERWAAQAPGMSDLMRSFPVAAFAVACCPIGEDLRRDGLAALAAGAPLGAVARALKLPLWTRRLSPEACAAPFRAVRGDEMFGMRALSCRPEEPEREALWFAALRRALDLGDTRFALWVAKQKAFARPVNARRDLRPLAAIAPLAAHAWCSLEPATPAGSYLDARFTAARGCAKALDAVQNWLSRIVNLHLRGGALAERWLTPTMIGPYRLTPLLDMEEFHRAGVALNNCLPSYWAKVARGERLVYTLRHLGWTTAAAELTPAPAQGSAPPHGLRLGQCLGRNNSDPGALPRVMMKLWLEKQPGPPPLRGDGLGILNADDVDVARWRALWAEAPPARGAGGADAGFFQPADARELRAQLTRRFEIMRTLSCAG